MKKMRNNNGTNTIIIAMLVSILAHVLIVAVWGPFEEKKSSPFERYTVEILYRDPGPQKAPTKAPPPPVRAVPVKMPVMLEMPRIEKKKTEETRRFDIREVEETLPVSEQAVVFSDAHQSNRFAVDYSLIVARLRKKIKASLVYPRLARRRGIQGTVLIHLEMDRDGNPVDLRVKNTSGSDILDRAALDLTNRVLPFRHRSDQSLTVEIPIVYRLVGR